MELSSRPTVIPTLDESTVLSSELIERLNPLCVRVAMCSPPLSQRVGRHCESFVVKEISVLNAVQDEELSESIRKMLMATAEFRKIGNVACL